MMKKYPINYYEVGNKIRVLRFTNAWSQESLAEKAGISTNYLSHIENGLSKFSLPIFVKIVNALNTTPNYILSDTINNKKDSIIEDIELGLLNMNNTELTMVSDFVNIINQRK